MLDLAGVAPPAAMQGRSFAPVAHGETPNDWRTEFYYEHYFQPVPSWNVSIPRSEGIRTARWKYIRYVDSDPLFEELYDLDADHLETTNLATDPAHAKRIQRFREQLLLMREAVK